jgi:3-oxoacyl-[acyl-carrier-protein] synthase-3
MYNPISFTIDAVSAIVGQNLTAQEWAEKIPVPNKKIPGTTLTGDDVTRITGVERKSWDPELFSDFTAIVQATREALDRAKAKPEDIDLVLIVTATPFYVQLDMDAFQLLKLLKLPDHIPPIQLNAGCAGMARAMHILSQTTALRPLIISYEVSSPYMSSIIYRENNSHPLKDSLWMSAALFSDGAAAVVLRRANIETGFSFYSRDSLKFGDQPGFEDPLIHYPGGGALHPPGLPGSEEMSAYGMSGPATKAYYEKGMMLNHETFLKFNVNYIHEVKRIYMHQANPKLVEGMRQTLIKNTTVQPEQLPKNAHLFGNLVTPSTLKLLFDDMEQGNINCGDKVCFSVVGAGPERGGFITSISNEW